jgi:hypothetical protein
VCGGGGGRWEVCVEYLTEGGGDYTDTPIHTGQNHDIHDDVQHQ